MYQFEYNNGLFDKEVDLIIKFISEELKSIKKIRGNLVTFAYTESVQGNLIFIKFQRILREIQRMNIEMDFLETKRQHYIEIKRKQKNL